MTDVPPPSTPTGPNYGPDFGVPTPNTATPDPAYPGSVPQRAEPSHTSGSHLGPSTSDIPEAAMDPQAGSGEAPPPAPQRASAGRNRIVAAVIGVATIGLLAWFLNSLRGDGPVPITLDTPTASSTPTASRSGSSTTTSSTPSYSPSYRTYSDRPVMPTPSQASPGSVPFVDITPGAKTVRFEVYSSAVSGDISLSDDTHRAAQLADSTLPWAAEMPVSDIMSSGWVSLTARVPVSSGGANRADVMCRVLVDGVLVVSQQSQGYAVCYLQPRYDIRRT